MDLFPSHCLLAVFTWCPWVPQTQPLQTHCLPLLEFPAPLPHQPLPSDLAPGFFLLTRSSASTVLTKQTKGPGPPPPNLYRGQYMAMKHISGSRPQELPWELTTDLTTYPLLVLCPLIGKTPPSHLMNFLRQTVPNYLLSFMHIQRPVRKDHPFPSLGAKAVCLSHGMPLECQVPQ